MSRNQGNKNVILARMSKPQIRSKLIKSVSTQRRFDFEFDFDFGSIFAPIIESMNFTYPLTPVVLSGSSSISNPNPGLWIKQSTQGDSEISEDKLRFLHCQTPCLLQKILGHPQ